MTTPLLRSEAYLREAEISAANSASLEEYPWLEMLALEPEDPCWVLRVLFTGALESTAGAGPRWLAQRSKYSRDEEEYEDIKFYIAVVRYLRDK